MIAVIAEHIKAHRHQLGKHTLLVGSAVKVPPKDNPINEAIELMAVAWAGDRVAGLEATDQAAAALKLMASDLPDHTERVRLLREQLGPDARPAEGHVRLARLIKEGYYSAVFLAEPDNMLERALHAQHMEPDKDYHLLVAGVDDPDDIKVALAESTRVAIIKCGGDLDQRFLPVSPEELSEVARDLHDTLAESLKLFTVFVGMTDRDATFLDHVPHEGGRLFWINPQIPMADAELYDQLKLENPASAEFHKLQPEVMQLLESRHSSRHLLCREPGSFNEFFAKLHTRLIRQRHRSHGKRRDLTVLRGGPYRFLSYFDVVDADFYFGREDDVKAVLEKVAEHPLTIVFGKPGIGKTSLLRAGVMASLRRETEEADKEQTHPWLIAYARLGEDPIASIRESVVAALEEAGYTPGDIAQREQLPEVVVGAAELAGRQVIILLDQFAEYFVKLGDMVRETLRQALRECLEQCGERFRLLIAIREDYLGELFELESDFPGIMQNMHRLHPLTREQAEDAILKPAQNFELQVERAVVRRAIDDLYRDGIEPAKLQVVCHSLYEGRSRGSYVITERIYDQLGGADEILDKYLTRVLNQLPPNERRVAQSILTYMAGTSELKAAQPAQRIAANASAEREMVDRVLARLVDIGLLRPVGRGRQRDFELVHELLADKIQADLPSTQTMLRNVQDMLTREMSNFSQFGLLINADELKLVGGARDELVISPEELKLIVRSALTAEVDVDYWIGRITDLEAETIEFAAALAHDDAAQVRLHVYRKMKPHLEPRLIRHLVQGLNDEQAEVRDLAKTYLGLMERHLVTMLGHSDHRVRALGARALADVGTRTHTKPLVEAFVEAATTLRDEITATLLELDDARAPDMLLRAVNSAPAEVWCTAYALGRLSVGEDDLRSLQRAASSRRKPELAYSLGVALTYRRSFAEAAEALAGAAAATESAAGRQAISAAEEDLTQQRERSIAGEDAWPAFGRGPGHRAYTAEEVTPPLELAWEFETKDHVVASPIARDNTAYIGSRDKHFYAIDTGKGTARWSFEADERIEGAAALIGDTVCFATLGGSVYALHVAAGEQQWRASLHAAIRSNCAAAGDSIYLGTRNGDIVRLGVADGEVVWRSRVSGEVSATPALSDDTLVAGSWDGFIYGFSAPDGAERWRQKTQGPVSSAAAIADGLAYCGSDDHGLYALRIEDGQQLWRAALGGPVRSTPALCEHLAVVGSIDGCCYAVARDSGRVVWRAETEEEIMSSPAISGGVVYVGSRDGSLYALSLADGDVLWRHSAAYGVYSSPAIAEQTVFVGFDYYNLAAFRPEAHSPRRR